MMQVSTLAALLLLHVLGATTVLAADSDFGELCLGPAKRNSNSFGAVLPPPGNPAFGKTSNAEYLIRVNNENYIAPDQKKYQLIRIPRRHQQHLFSFFIDRKLNSSFVLTFSDMNKQCLIFDSQYETWSFVAKDRLSNCGCW